MKQIQIFFDRFVLKLSDNIQPWFHETIHILLNVFPVCMGRSEQLQEILGSCGSPGLSRSTLNSFQGRLLDVVAG